MQHVQSIKHKGKKKGKNSLDPMSETTKDFIQKICYRRAASVDMTQHGFMSDSKTRPTCLLLKPLKEKLRTICENSIGAGSRSGSRSSSPVSLVKGNISDEKQSRKIQNTKKIHFSPETEDSPRKGEEQVKQRTHKKKAKKARNRSPRVSLMLKTGVIKVNKQKK